MSRNVPAALFIADHLALDFLNTGRFAIAAEEDWLGDGQHLLVWLGSAQLVPQEVLADWESRGERLLLDKIAGRARGLRRWLRDFVNAYQGQSLPPLEADVFGPLNEILRSDQRYIQLSAAADNTGIALESAWQWHHPQSLLRPVAQQIAQLVCEVDFARIKPCDRCGLLFVDRTRHQARRWCSMTTCGNRSKQATHRKRRKRRR